VAFRGQVPDITDQQIALQVLNLLRRDGGLAVLMDRTPAILCLEGEHLTLRGSMSYSYVFDYWSPRSSGLALYPSNSSDTSIERDETLERIVNAKVDALAGEIPELARAIEYSRVAALLRWARAPGHLAGVDFADLVEVAARDRVNTPTPDAVRR
jgi:hypothetical protein